MEVDCVVLIQFNPCCMKICDRLSLADTPIGGMSLILIKTHREIMLVRVLIVLMFSMTVAGSPENHREHDRTILAMLSLVMDMVVASSSWRHQVLSCGFFLAKQCSG